MKDFLASEIPDLPAKECLFHIIPAPYEKTVSYGGGASRGPEAILEASYQLEAYDGRSCPCEKGIHTRRPCDSLEAIGTAAAEVLALGKIPVILGGEHTVSYAGIKALRDSGREFGVVQIDAHADLREEYEGNKFSHACVMKRVVDMGIPLFQIGVRALSLPEAELRKEKGIGYVDGCEIGNSGLPDQLPPPDFPKNIYLTFDVDGLDCSLMPSTGTPEPGGLTWFQTMDCLRKISDHGNILGCDFVELAPIPDLHAPDFLTARLIYNFMGMISRRQSH